MKKLVLLILCLFAMNTVLADEDYAQIYESLQPPTFTLLKNIDPFQEQDYYDYAWAPYPLFRTSSALIFKDNTIQPGYYLLAARTMHGKDYVFFKEQGIVSHVIPVYKKESVPQYFYDNVIPKPQKTKWENFTTAVQNKFFKAAKNSKRKPPPDSYIQTLPIDDTYVVIVLYYGPQKYFMLFKKQQY